MTEITQGWHYVGQDEKLFGPFLSAKMREWWEGGFLPMTLQVKWGVDGKFKQLRDLGPTVFTPNFENSEIYNEKPSSGRTGKKTRRAVLAMESFDDVDDLKIEKIPKKASDKKAITEALKSNYLFSSLHANAIQLAVDAMKPVKAGARDFILKQGTSGDDFFVMTDGEVQYRVDGKVVGGQKGLATFGELALIYNSPRNADVVAMKSCQLWSITRSIFRKALSSAVTTKHLRHIKLLEEVPSLKDLTTNQINTLAGALVEVTYQNGASIITQGDFGDVFYIISEGIVDVSIGGKMVAKLKAGQFFGERALIKDEPRDATCSSSGKTVCLTLEKKHFKSLLGNLEDIKTVSTKREIADGLVDSPSNATSAAPRRSEPVEAPTKKKKNHNILKLDEFKVLRIIGQGTFGKVKLAQHVPTNRVMAMKCLQKNQIWNQKQVTNVLNEKDAMEAIDHPFVLKLLGTFQNTDELFFFLEIVQGGELWSLLYQSAALPRMRLGGFEEITARIYAAEVIAGLGYVHKCGYMYRDLKPENLMVDKHGYLKIVDFGFCKKIPVGKKSQTLCGTPEYLSPELVLQKGHTHCVDYWAFGCLVYELLTNDTPFADPQQSRIFKKIVNSDRLMPHMFARGFPSKARNLIEQLLQPIPAMRLGMQKNGPADIFAHEWFAGIDWEKLAAKRYKAPYKPQIDSDLDDRNFDRYDDDNAVEKFTASQDIFKDFT